MEKREGRKYLHAADGEEERKESREKLMKKMKGKEKMS